MLQVKTVSQASLASGIKAVLYGRAGVGKTMLCATAPRPLIVSAEAGLLSLAHAHPNIPVVEISSVEDLTAVHNWATSSAEAQHIDTVCLDSLSEIAEVVLANAKAQVRDPRQAYGELLEKMTMTVRAFRDLPGKNVVFVSKEEYSKDERGVARYQPLMPGNKLSQSLPYLVDEVFRLCIGRDEAGTEYRYLQCHPDVQSDAKDRSGRLDAFEAPNLAQVFNKILGR